MKLRVFEFPSQPKHKGFVGCVAWTAQNELVSCGDDHRILLFQAEEHSVHDPSALTNLSEEIFPTDIHFLPKTTGQSGAGGASGKASRVEFVLTATNGCFMLCAKSGAVEKTVEAHRGAILAGRWNHDGSALGTCGEDGEIKIWSKSGMLRSKLQLPFPVYTFAWGGANEAEQSQQFVYSQNKELVIASTKPSTSPVRWKAHEALILKVDWNPCSNLIISGGEDRKYKVWDNYGRNIFSSYPQSHDHPVTSLAWAPDGTMFAVGSYNTLRLCDKNGPSMSLEKRETGSVFSMAWSHDSTQVAGACALGHVLFANVVDKKYQWKNYEAIVTGPKQFTIIDVINGTETKKELNDRIINAALGYKHLVVVTMSFIYIFNVTALGVKDQQVNFSESFVPIVGLTEKYFAIVHSKGINMYFYETGKQMKGSVDFKNINVNANVITPSTVSFSNDTIAIKDFKNEKNIVFYFWDNINAQWMLLKAGAGGDDPSGGAGGGSGAKKSVDLVDASQGRNQEVVSLALDQHSGTQHVAYIDKNNDVYLKAVKSKSGGTGGGGGSGVKSGGGGSGSVQSAANLQSVKLTSMVSSMCWSDSANILAVMHDSHFTLILYPSVVFIDRDLLPVTMINVDTSEFGRNPVITGFVGNQVILRKSDGTCVGKSVTPYATVLHELVRKQKWAEAERVCNSVSMQHYPEEASALWASLAAMAVHGRNLSAAQAAYASIMEIDKVEALEAIAKSANVEAEMFFLQGFISAAEDRLLPTGGGGAGASKQAAGGVNSQTPEEKKKIKRAIEMNMEVFRWRRALQLAKKYSVAIDDVIEAKARYNKHAGKTEETDQQA